MNILKTAVAVSAITVLAGPALANGHSMKGKYAEPVVETPPAPVVAPAFTWTGAYVGGGLGWGEVSREYEGFVPFAPRSTPEVQSMPSLTEETDSGLAYGFFAGYNFQMNDLVLGGEFELGLIDLDEIDLDYTARLKGRLGFAMDNVLVYGTAGAAYASAEDTSDWGYFGGVGVEVAMDGNWFIGAEATHTRFDDFGDLDTDVTANVFNARVGFRF